MVFVCGSPLTHHNITLRILFIQNVVYVFIMYILATQNMKFKISWLHVLYAIKMHIYFWLVVSIFFYTYSILSWKHTSHAIMRFQGVLLYIQYILKNVKPWWIEIKCRQLPKEPLGRHICWKCLVLYGHVPKLPLSQGTQCFVQIILRLFLTNSLSFMPLKTYSTG